MSDEDALDKARVMIVEIKAALAAGTEHYDAQGRLLNTPSEIVAALLRDGSITFRSKPQEHS